ncbi:MAG: bifunctional (p)ppGpp synthetase/guanosine-3',5'-bis(diphosphate) 3'-pyrophosphohydrolase, partial [Cyanobacteria bacterium P01_D01_bin.73]
MEVFDTWRSWQGARYFLEHKLSARDLTELEVTFQFAVKCHDRQTRPDGTPYAVHLLEVIEILSK